MVLNFNGGGQMSREDVRGEAVFLDLGQGRNLVLLLLFDPCLPTQALFGRAGFNAVETLLQGRKLEGSVELRPDLIPTLVSFSDLSDPASARVVPPSDAGFAAAFGPGFRLAGVTLEMVPVGVWPFNLVGLSGTPVTRGIEGKVPWWSKRDGMTWQGLCSRRGDLPIAECEQLLINMFRGLSRSI